ncbi:flagellar hook-length control protein FliK [Dyella subtropica]|uniref:flagellar hook-length control protein FliK n=1 Tax=Dyella subtropica TaxID=2992127 RepID=UPI002254826B|nr:flagellar hook-length control protein FliK [Dyella subtropica]
MSLSIPMPAKTAAISHASDPVRSLSPDTAAQTDHGAFGRQLHAAKSQAGNAPAPARPASKTTAVRTRSTTHATQPSTASQSKTSADAPPSSASASSTGSTDVSMQASETSGKNPDTAKTDSNASKQAPLAVMLSMFGPIPLAATPVVAAAPVQGDGALGGVAAQATTSGLPASILAGIKAATAAVATVDPAMTNSAGAKPGTANGDGDTTETVDASSANMAMTAEKSVIQALAAATHGDGASNQQSGERKDDAQPNMLSGLIPLSGNLSTPATSAAHALTMTAPAGTPTFTQELGQQVAWLGGQQVKEARIRLQPQELGTLDVKVSVEHNRVDVSFTAQHSAAVTAVQQSLGQLDLMLAGQGLSLGQAHVGQQDRGRAGQGGTGATASQADEAEPVAQSAAVAVRTVALGLLDTFA